MTFSKSLMEVKQRKLGLEKKKKKQRGGSGDEAAEKEGEKQMGRLEGKGGEREREKLETGEKKVAGCHANSQCSKINSVCVACAAPSPSTSQAGPVLPCVC